MIHVCFGLYDATGRYSKFTGTAMLSIFQNTAAPVTVHILHDDTLTADNRDKFLQIATRFNRRVNFYNVDELCRREIAFIRDKLAEHISTRFTIAMLYRFFIPKILAADIEKIIYLDSDIIVNLDIAQLWDINLADKILGAVAHSETEHVSRSLGITAEQSNYLIASGRIAREDYFNSGVLLVNLNSWRTDERLSIFSPTFTAETAQFKFFDQDILNCLYAKKYLKLPAKFNRLIQDARKENKPCVEKKIYHFADMSLGLETNDPFNRLWMEYFAQTPWFDLEIFARINDAFREKYLELYQLMKNSLAQLSATVSDKARGFFIMSGDSDALKKIFAIRDDEEIIFADTNNALPKLVAAMGKASGKKIFFLVVPDFDAVSNLLQQIDFVPDNDFLDGSNFVMRKKDWEFHPFPLLKAM